MTVSVRDQSPPEALQKVLWPLQLLVSGLDCVRLHMRRMVCLNHIEKVYRLLLTEYEENNKDMIEIH